MKKLSEANEEDFCPVLATLELLNQRWTLHIVRSLLNGPKRFNELARENGINPRTLRDRLRSLEQEQVVSREVFSSIPPNVRYSLTPKGLALSGIFDGLGEWGREWMERPPDASD